MPSISSISTENNAVENVAIEHSTDQNEILVKFDNLDLSPEHPDSPEILVEVERLPTFLVNGSSYFNVEIDDDSPNLEALKSQAEQLKEFPEAVRVRALQRITNETITFATDEVIDNISHTNSDLAKWVSENTGLDSGFTNIKLSELQSSGYGVCRHMAVFYLWLAQHAGLRGVLAEAPQETIRNIRKPDGNTLFKSVGEGELVKSGHAWTELYLSDGTIIPVDPSKNLVGDTPESKIVFQDANYKSANSSLLDLDIQPREYVVVVGHAPYFNAGEKLSSMSLRTHLKTVDPISSLNFDTLTWETEEGSNEPYKGSAELKIAGVSFQGQNNQTANIRPTTARIIN